MTAAADWRSRVGDVWAEEWRRTDRSFADLSRHLDAAIVAAAPGTGEALDIGCGAGGTSLALAAARPGLAITGIDLSPPMIAVAADRARRAGLADRAAFGVGAVEALPAEPRFDLLVSRHGVMFFAAPAAAFARLRAVARPGASLAFSCFGPRAANRFATLADDLLGRASPEPVGHAPGPFAFADDDRVAALLGEAGWHAGPPVRLAFSYRAGEGSDPVADAAGFLSRIGAVAGVLRDAAPGDRPRLHDELVRLLARHRRGDTVDLPAQASIWVARADRNG